MKNNRISLFWLLAGLVVVCTLIVIAIYFSVETKSRDSILTETAKSFIQLGAIGVLGAFVKFAFDQISESQRKQQADLEVKREMLERLRKFKQVVKAIPYYIEEERTVEAYHREMKVLLNTYMEIADFGSDTRLLEFIHPYNERIGIHFWMMSIFASEILDEVANPEQEIKSWEQIIQLPKYNYYRKSALDFRGKEDKSTPYRVDFDAHYDAIKTDLKLLIAERRSPKWNQTKGSISSLNMDEYNKSAGIMYQLKFKYSYYVRGRKIDSNNTFKSFDERVIKNGFDYLSKVKKEVTVYYDPMNLEISVVHLL